ncbi:antibiotic biosynthesis monooxygenase [Cyanobium sp. Morenito 9A2]|uniref:antibiotic biosynthesis monooxygenase n=1 Tax=Cyanobium sp. Morenito 9A2 TaxID=2823718 RepID=UPI0020CBFF9B|nr:antibiotic biosynthesis monooxygenase [Cyanobium sp. Morenito 9A2]MCP9849541.1 antibiotic biosynthesis monooxygenase [Cyanobium sp. Morenito 9A2]
MPHVLILHAVESYPAWKRFFDDAATIRREAGEISFQLLRDASDPQQLVHLSAWTSLAAARLFFESPELVKLRQEAGVHAPTFLYLDELERGVL